MGRAEVPLELLVGRDTILVVHCWKLLVYKERKILIKMNNMVSISSSSQDLPVSKIPCPSSFYFVKCILRRQRNSRTQQAQIQTF